MRLASILLGSWSTATLASPFLREDDGEEHESKLRVAADVLSRSADIDAPSNRTRRDDDEDMCEAIGWKMTHLSSEVPIFVPAEDAMSCLTSVPINVDDAKATLESLRRTLQFHSQLSQLKVSGYGEVDLIDELNELEAGLTPDMYQYNFEMSVSIIMEKAMDSHLQWRGYLSQGLFEWERPVEFALVSVSISGRSPEIHCLSDVLTGIDNPVVEINDIPARQFLVAEGNARGFVSDDAALNYMTAKPMGWMNEGLMDVAGGFIESLNYPGPETKLKWANGDVKSEPNDAMPFQNEENIRMWAAAENAGGMYDTIVQNSDAFDTAKHRTRSETSNSTRAGFADLVAEGKRLRRLRRQHRLRQNEGKPEKRAIAIKKEYTRPDLTTLTNEIELAVYFVKGPQGRGDQFAVLRVADIKGGDETSIKQYLDVLRGFVQVTGERRTPKIIVDFRHFNEDFYGSKVGLAYQTFKSVFYSINPTTPGTFRSSDIANLMANAFEGTDLPETQELLSTNILTLGPYLDQAGHPFANWDALSQGPLDAEGDKTSNVFEANFPKQGLNFDGSPWKPFWKPEDVVLLTDGVCESACQLMAEWFTQQAKVKSFVIGGQFASKEMALVGGTKGVIFRSMEYLGRLAAFSTEYVEKFTGGNPPDIFPAKPPVRSVNIRTRINWSNFVRDPTASPVESTYEAYDAADCHLQYTPRFIASDMDIWKEVYDIAWGNRRRFQYDRCSQDSTN